MMAREQKIAPFCDSLPRTALTLLSVCACGLVASPLDPSAAEAHFPAAPITWDVAVVISANNTLHPATVELLHLSENAVGTSASQDVEVCGATWSMQGISIDRLGRLDGATDAIIPVLACKRKELAQLRAHIFLFRSNEPESSAAIYSQNRLSFSTRYKGGGKSILCKPRLDIKIVVADSEWIEPHDRGNGNYLAASPQQIWMSNVWILHSNLLSLDRGLESAQTEQSTITLGISLEVISELEHSILQRLALIFPSVESNPEELDMWGRELLELKRILLETPPMLLSLTFIVSIMHIIFDLLALKSEVQFWSDLKSMTGMSSSSLITRWLCQVIILLYLVDNSSATIVLLSQSLSLLLETWKCCKALRPIICVTQLFPGFKISYVYFAGRSKNSISPTEQYDIIASRTVWKAIAPLLVGFSLYKLVHETKEGFYKWALGTAVGFVYSFGFVLMTPQLFINYKLKSVEHLPWASFVYRALNTFIDDLFALIVRMPTMHRVACMRDDIIFFALLYQRYLYRRRRTKAYDGGKKKKETSQ